MKGLLVISFVCCAGLAGVVTGQTVRTWTGNSDQRWNRNANWSANNQPNASNEVAEFGSGLQLNPELNANNIVVRGIRFGAGASSYHVGDDNGARTLKIGNGSSGFIENVSAIDQTVAIATLQFQSDATISTAGGALNLISNLTGNNRDLTFSAAGAIRVTGNIATGSGTVTKEGIGELHLSGANSYTGLTTVNAGAIVLAAANVFADSAGIALAAGATLRLDDFSDTISHVTGSGAIDFGLAGSGQLTLGSGLSAFAGAFLGRGELVIGAGATLTLGSDFSNADLNIRLAGGTLDLAGHRLSAGALTVSGNSIIDFATGANSLLTVDSFGFDSADLLLTVQNWTDAADYFYSHAAYTQGAAPLNQVQFQGWDFADAKWQDYDSQVTPVPEPSAYGACLLGAAMVILVWRRYGCR